MIKLIKNYPYDNKYDYVKLFSTKDLQRNYFNSFGSIRIDEGEDEGYIREGETFIVEYNYDYLVSEGVNYVIWNNGFKDLYCFITKKEYVSEELTRIYYEVDVLNTFCFDITIKKSFIERKKCSVSEITDFDEGLEIGEHQVKGTVASIKKEYKYYAMFNGIKEQNAVFNNGKLVDVVEIPSPSMKPSTIIQKINYPLHFMPLKSEYAKPKLIDVSEPMGGTGSGNGGDLTNPLLSRQGFRFIKGFEGFAPRKYQDSGGYWTIAYGITKHGEPSIYNDLVSKEPVTEEEGAKISYNQKNKGYAEPIFEHLKNNGITKQYQFDALVSLAYNSGVGSIIGSNDLMNAIRKDPTNENVIRPLWETFKVTSNGQPLNGLKLRRKQECNMFFNKPYEVRKISLITSSGSYSGYVEENSGNGWLPNTDGGIE